MNKLSFKQSTYDSDTPFWDILIDNKSIRDILDSDSITPIGWGVKAESRRAINKIRIKEKSDLFSGKIELLVCPACGDIGCGAITVSISRKDGTIIWHDFISEDGSKGDENHPFEKIDVGSFVFEKNQYFHAFMLSIKFDYD